MFAMPHPKNRLKRTGDTHPPEVENDLGREPENEPAAEPPTVVVVPDLRAEGAALLPEIERREMHRYLEAARSQVRARPLAAVVGAFVLGLVLARI